MITATAARACAKGSARSMNDLSPALRASRMPRVNRIGTTIRSWNSSTDSATRPSGVAARCCSTRICITIAVEDSAKHMPRTRPAGGVMPLMRMVVPTARMRNSDLHQADAQHIAAQLPQPRQRQFHAEQEQQEHDAEFGERLGRLRVLQRDVAQDRIIIVEIAERRTARAQGRSAESPARCRDSGAAAAR